MNSTDILSEGARGLTLEGAQELTLESAYSFQKGASACLVAFADARPRLETTPLAGQRVWPAGPASTCTTASSDAPSACKSYPPSVTRTIRPSQHSSATARSSSV